MKIIVVGDARSTHVRMRTDALREAGASCVLISQRDAFGNNNENENIIVPVYKSVLPWPLSRYRALFDIYSAFCSIRRIRADIVLVQFGASRLSWLSLLASRRPLAVVAMGGDVLFEEQANLREAEKELTRRLFLNADLVFAKSPYISRKLVEMGVDRNRIHTCLWGVNPEVFNVNHSAMDTDIRMDLGVGKDIRIILSPRILQPLYNIDQIVSSMAVVRMRVPNAHLFITEYQADPAYKHQLQKIVTELNLDDCVHFIGEKRGLACTD